ncbi:alpha-L-fucosidase [Sphingobacterium phlebotomi]|uniref:alpha-L-fucosidase n=1 Tax=Sphingobacterium phlebotomi TaxID=2605433 RepID=A0A5D4H6J8_9SPHI|nr:alpha-L-fucosidase [Sphingobacterium phlebotomi]TYR36671.1 alpha-L-fucosidase [Sphingobacterium phlebotomi]
MKYVIMLLLTAVWSGDALCQSMENDWNKMNRSKEHALREFQQQKFGLFIHWGLYAIPGGVWKGKTMEEMGIPSVAEWIQLVAKIPRKEYADLAASFNPVDFDADHIVTMAKEAGMKYIVITSKHHDGFALFDSKVSDFDMMDATPFKRDIVRELYDACQRHQLEFGVYYSHNIDWADGADAQYATTKAANDRMGKDTDSFGANLWDPSPNTFSSYLKNKAIPQVKELLEQYPDIRYIWFDMPGLMTREQSYTFYKTVYDINPSVLVAERIGNNMGDYAIPGDNRIPTAEDQFDKPWEAIGTFNHSWGYKAYDQDWKSVDELLYWLVEIVSKGGNYMLNIGPDAQGNVAPTVRNNLQKLGSWMTVNKEAIYGSKPWKVQREGPTTVYITDTEQREKEGFKAAFTSQDFWFTEREKYLYVVSLELPESGVAVVKSLAKGQIGVKQVEILGIGKVAFSQTEEGLLVKLPKAVRKLPKGYTLKITPSSP